MINLRGIFNPGLYHGPGRARHFFEGWYYKIADAEGKNICGIIPAIYINKDNEEETQSFIQIFMNLDSQRDKIHQRYSADQFRAASKEFKVEIGNSFFSRDRLKLNIDNDRYKISGDLRFSRLSPWPVRILSPGAMGWYAYAPFMECYHGVLSFDHRIEGELRLDDKVYDYSGGRGYLEKDWGKSFPKAWVWLQSNHFTEEETSLFASLAMVPWLGRELRGFIIGLWRQGELYTFTTYNRAKLEKVEINNNSITLKVSKKRYQLNIEAAASDWTELYGPYRERMKENVRESLSAEVFVELVDKKQNKNIFVGQNNKAGLEINGELAKLNNPPRSSWVDKAGEFFE